jgi:hypothetical protein
VKKTSLHLDCLKTSDGLAQGGYNMTWPAWAVVYSEGHGVFTNPVQLYRIVTINKHVTMSSLTFLSFCMFWAAQATRIKVFRKVSDGGILRNEPSLIYNHVDQRQIHGNTQTFTKFDPRPRNPNPHFSSILILSLPSRSNWWPSKNNSARLPTKMHVTPS